MIISVKKLLFFVFLLMAIQTGFTQQIDLFKMQDSTNAIEDNKYKSSSVPLINTFFSTRLVSSHTTEITGIGSMDFRINHRFGPVNNGLYDVFGLDYASMRMGFDFGITKNLMVGFGRSTYNKEYDGLIKYRLMKQSSGTRSMPLSIAILGTYNYKTIDMDPALKVSGADRTFISTQLLLSRKFNENTSIQLSPTYTRYNRIIYFTGGSKDMFALGFLIRQKVSKRVSINAEYFYQTNRFNGTYDPLSIGVDINTGGHVFQLHFTNSPGMNEHTYIHENTGSWSNGDVRMGFNISRTFNVSKKK